MRIALRCPLGDIRAWLLLGPRPDGSFHGKDDVEALVAISAPLQRTLFQVTERERVRRRLMASNREFRRVVNLVSSRLSALESVSAIPAAELQPARPNATH